MTFCPVCKAAVTHLIVSTADVPLVSDLLACPEMPPDQKLLRALHTMERIGEELLERLRRDDP